LNSFHCKKAKTVILQLACQNLPCRKTHGPVVLPFKGKEFIAALNRYEQHRREKNTKLTPTARSWSLQQAYYSGKFNAASGTVLDFCG